RIHAVSLGDVQLAAGLLLVDGNKAAAAIGVFAEDAERARPGMRDDADDAAAIGRAVGLVRLLDAQQRAVADAGRGARLRAAREDDADFWRGAAFFLVPFGGGGEQLAVRVAAGDVGEHGMRQLRRLMYLAPALGDRAFVGEFAQNALQLGAVGILQPELARDFAGADLAGMGADEGEDGVAAREALLAPPAHPRALPAF